MIGHLTNYMLGLAYRTRMRIIHRVSPRWHNYRLRWTGPPPKFTNRCTWCGRPDPLRARPSDPDQPDVPLSLREQQTHELARRAEEQTTRIQAATQRLRQANRDRTNDSWWEE